MSGHQKKHLIRTTATAITVIALGALIIAYTVGAGIPRAFFEARIQAAGAANHMAVLINNSLTNLRRIEEYEQSNSTDQALDLITFELGGKQEKQNAAVLLASSLENMAQSAVNISSGDARGLAIEAVTSGVSMVSRMVSYNSALDQLFTAIQSKLHGNSGASGNSIRTLLAGINSDAQAINDLNNGFNRVLSQFDQRYSPSK